MKHLESESTSESFAVQEYWSALHDGELSEAQAAALVSACLADESLMLQWRSMSLISHVMHAQQGSLVIQQVQPVIAAQPSLTQEPARVQEAANDGVFRWKMLASVAALAAVGSLSWALLGAPSDKAGLAQNSVMAQNQNAPVLVPGQGLIAVGGQVAGQEITMIRNPRLDELLLAHKQFGGVSALQQPAGSLRSVSLASQRP